jgi:hypothetical protein
MLSYCYYTRALAHALVLYLSAFGVIHNLPWTSGHRDRHMIAFSPDTPCYMFYHVT